MEIQRLPKLKSGQALEHGAPALGVAAGANLTGGFVIQNTAGFLGWGNVQHPAIHRDAGMALHPVAQGGSLAIHGHAAIGDPALHFTARTQPGTGQYFLQLLAANGSLVRHSFSYR